MKKFIYFSTAGLLISEIFILGSYIIRKLFNVSLQSGQTDLILAIGIFSFLGFSILTAISLIAIIFKVLSKQPIQLKYIWFITAFLLWVPTNIAILATSPV